MSSIDHILLQPGTDLNSGIRSTLTVTTPLGIASACIYFAVGLAMSMWWLFFLAIPTFMRIGVAIAQFLKFGPVIVLGDGLDIGGRFIPYNSITFVGRRWATWQMMTIEYLHHGAKLEAYVTTPVLGKHRFDLDELVAALALRAGIPPTPAIGAQPQPPIAN